MSEDNFDQSGNERIGLNATDANSNISRVRLASLYGRLRTRPEGSPESKYILIRTVPDLIQKGTNQGEQKQGTAECRTTESWRAGTCFQQSSHQERPSLAIPPIVYHRERRIETLPAGKWKRRA